MKITILGAGALGSLVGGLVAGRHEVTLIGRKDHVEAIRRDGLRIEGIRTQTVPLDARTQPDGSEAPDLLFLTMKAHQTAASLKDAASLVGPSTILVTLQNGLGNYEALQKAFPDNVILAASVTVGAMLAAPGRVLYTGQGDVLVGGTAKQLDSAGRVARLLRESGLRALGVPDILGPLWQKAIVNAAINPLTALKGCTNGELLEDEAALERMRKVVAEGVAVARAKKITLPERDVFHLVQKVAEATAKNRSSMLQDLERGGRTEIDAINGALVAAGKAAGVPTPENAALVAEIHAREKKA